MTDSPALRTYREAAAILRQPSDWWLRRNISRLPHLKIGRQVLFTDEDLAAILQICRVQPFTIAGPPDAPPAVAPVAAVPQLVPSRVRRRRNR
jgi:hypothetical protein